MNKKLILLFVFVFTLTGFGCTFKIAYSKGGGRGSKVINLDALTINGVIRYENVDLIVTGPVVVNSGSSLELVNCRLYINGSVSEPNNITVKGDALFRVENTVIDGYDYFSFFFYALEEGGFSPRVEIVDNSRVNAPFGWMMLDNSVLYARDSILGDTVAGDNTDWDIARCTISMVMIKMDDFGNTSLSGMDAMTRYADLSMDMGGGSSLDFTDTYIDWWKMELKDQGTLSLADSNGITLGLTSPSRPGAGATYYLDEVTSRNKNHLLSKNLTFADQTIYFDNVYHKVMDIYVAGDDEVFITDSTVNEPQVWGRGRLVIGSAGSNTRVVLNTGQVFERGEMVLESTTMFNSGAHLLQIRNRGQVYCRNADVSGLTVEITGENARLEFENCTGLNSVTIFNDGATVLVDGAAW